MASTGETWRLGRRPALDGLRGIAILLVIGSHSYVPGFASAGVAGVTLFFTLSGFLITSLLLKEHGQHGRISLRGFYLRRARRLLPPVLASTAAVGAMSLLIGAWYFPRGAALGVLGYVANWFEMNGSTGGLTGYWSLSVEEQFYLVWPALLIGCLQRSRRAVAVVCVLGALASIATRFALWEAGAGWRRVYYGSDMHVDALLIGCLLAVVMTTSRTGRNRPLLAAACAAPLVLVVPSVDPTVMWTVVPLVMPLATAVAIWAMVSGESSIPVLSSRALGWVGRRSYGLYLWHVPVNAFLTLARPDLNWHFRLALILVIGVPLTLLSWRYIEEPLLRHAVQPRLASGLEVGATSERDGRNGGGVGPADHEGSRHWIASLTA